jgi:hypothetical protein
VKPTIWHYTTRDLWPSIRHDGYIRVATANLGRKETPLAWFSEDQLWERTAAKGLKVSGVVLPRTLTYDEMIDHGLVRIAVTQEAAPYDWTAIKKWFMPPLVARGLSVSGRERGANPNEWRASLGLPAFCGHSLSSCTLEFHRAHVAQIRV